MSTPAVSAPVAPKDIDLNSLLAPGVIGKSLRDVENQFQETENARVAASKANQVFREACARLEGMQQTLDRLSPNQLESCIQKATELKLPETVSLLERISEQRQEALDDKKAAATEGSRFRIFSKLKRAFETPDHLKNHWPNYGDDESCHIA